MCYHEEIVKTSHQSGLNPSDISYMGLYLKILDSTDPSVISKLQKAERGLLIGRAKGNLIIEDERISSVHAEIQKNNQGEFFLVDKDSRNGIKVQGKRISKLVLIPGTIFQIGNTLIEVIFIENEDKTVIDQNPEPDQIEDAKLLLDGVEVESFESAKPVFFANPIKLKVIQGMQLNQNWFLEYGPYKFGSGCVGGLLVGEHMPPEVFEISENNKGKIIKVLTLEPIVRLNSIPVSGESLIDSGDILSIDVEGLDTTRIRLEF